MLKLMDKKTFTSLRSKYMLICTHGYCRHHGNKAPSQAFAHHVNGGSSNLEANNVDTFGKHVHTIGVLKFQTLVTCMTIAVDWDVKPQTK